MITCIVPTKNRTVDLQKFYDSLVNQTKQPDQFIIIDQSDEKSFLKINKSNECEILHIHDNEISGLCAAKNLGIKYATGEYLFFFDDDIILDNNFFEIIMDHFQNNAKLDGICGRQKNSVSSKFKVFIFNLFHRGPFKDTRKKCNSGYEKKAIVYTSILPGGITAYRRNVFDKYLFDENLVKYCLGEDMDFSYRASKDFKFAFATDALALHDHSNIGRYNPIESFACKLVSYDYFFKKNIVNNFRNRYAYFLVRLGLILDAFSYSIKHLNLNAFKGFKKGRKYIKNNYKNVPFIRFEDEVNYKDSKSYIDKM